MHAEWSQQAGGGRTGRTGPEHPRLQNFVPKVRP